MMDFIKIPKSFIFSVAAIFFLTLAAIVSVAFLFGQNFGKNQFKIDALEQAQKAIERRGDIDELLKNHNDYDVCVLLGGLPNECEIMRRMDKEPKDKPTGEPD